MKTEIQESGVAAETGNIKPSDEFLTKKELAAQLKVTLRTIEQWQHDGHLPYLKISAVILFHWPEVVTHLKANFRVCPGGKVRPTCGKAESGNAES